ncbi:MAG TPA: hypothetical protein VMQ56_07670 [Terracidiphilus sp.]|jgi:hypothetical protein|nr:hypothetical protein [Terracidiphilus sp.]
MSRPTEETFRSPDGTAAVLTVFIVLARIWPMYRRNRPAAQSQ